MLPQSFDFGVALGVLGVVLTVVFFVIGYRQTIGAKKERILSANKEIVDTLMRRLVLDGLEFDQASLKTYIAGKAKDARVGGDDLYDSSVVLSVIFQRILSLDYIGHEQRQKLLALLSKAIGSVEADSEKLPGPVLAKKLREFPNNKLLPRLRLYLYPEFQISLLAVSLSAVSVISILLATEGELSKDNLWLRLGDNPIFIALLFVAGALSLVMASYLRLRERLESSKSKQQIDAVSPRLTQLGELLESRARRISAIAGYSVIDADSNDPFDFSIRKGDEIILIDVVLSLRRLPRNLVLSKVSHLNQAAQNSRAKKAIIVTDDSIPSVYLNLFSGDTRVKACQISEFRSVLSSAS